VKLGLNADRIQRTDVRIIDIDIILFFPMESAIEEATSIVTARNPVEIDNDRLAVAGDTLNSSVKIGKSVWTEYRIIKLIKLPEKSAKIALL
jgi:hypothetical protein